MVCTVCPVQSLSQPVLDGKKKPGTRKYGGSSKARERTRKDGVRKSGPNACGAHTRTPFRLDSCRWLEATGAGQVGSGEKMGWEQAQ